MNVLSCIVELLFKFALIVVAENNQVLGARPIIIVQQQNLAMQKQQTLTPS